MVKLKFFYFFYKNASQPRQVLQGRGVKEEIQSQVSLLFVLVQARCGRIH
jgi:hypothetical protein